MPEMKNRITFFSLFIFIRGPPRPLPGQCWSAGPPCPLFCPHGSFQPFQGTYLACDQEEGLSREARISGCLCARVHHRRRIHTRALRASACAHRRWRTRTLIAFGSCARSSPEVHVHTPGAHHRRRMRSDDTRAFTLRGGVVAAYLDRLANPGLRCSRSLCGRGASANGSSACGPAR
jgi:hypothetical protein